MGDVNCSDAGWLPGNHAVRYQVSDGVNGLGWEFSATGEALELTSPLQFGDRVSAGVGAKGHRYYDWAFITLPQAADRHQGHHWLLIRPQPHHR
jgi:hypothetical protein